MKNEELIRQMAKTLLTLEKGYSMMYETMMEDHKRLNRLVAYVKSSLRHLQTAWIGVKPSDVAPSDVPVESANSAVEIAPFCAAVILP